MVEETIPGAPDPASPGVTVPPTTIMVPEEVPTPSFDSFCGTHLSCRWCRKQSTLLNYDL